MQGLAFRGRGPMVEIDAVGQALPIVRGDRASLRDRGKLAVRRQCTQLRLRRAPAALRGERNESPRMGQARLDVDARGREHGELRGRFRAAAIGCIDQKASALGGQQRRIVADDQPLAEPRRRLDVTELSCPRERVNRIVVCALGVALLGNYELLGSAADCRHSPTRRAESRLRYLPARSYRACSRFE